MVVRVALLSAALATSVCSVGEAFVSGGAFLSRRAGIAPRSRQLPTSVAETAYRGRNAPLMSTSTDLKELGLTPELERLTKVFRSCPTDKMRQMQLLHLAQMGDKMDPALQTEENKVLG